jgi:hypothetical protein
MVMKFRTGDEIKKELDEIVLEKNKDIIVNLIEEFKNEYLMKGWSKTPFRPEKNIFDSFKTLPNNYNSRNWYKSRETIYLDNYLEEIKEFFVENFYRYNKPIFSLIKNEILPQIKEIIEAEDNYDDQDTEAIAKKIIAEYIWSIIIRKNNVAQRALGFLGEFRDEMVYNGHKKGISKKESVERDLINACAETEYNEYRFA